jgi:hypothetical protein
LERSINKGTIGARASGAVACMDSRLFDIINRIFKIYVENPNRVGNPVRVPVGPGWFPGNSVNSAKNQKNTIFATCKML